MNQIIADITIEQFLNHLYDKYYILLLYLNEECVSLAFFNKKLKQ